jgi:cytochrome c
MRRTVALLVLMLSYAAARADEPDAGEAMLRRCAICHSLDGSARIKVGPDLKGVFGRKAVWDDDTLATFLRDPKDSLPGNRMSFPGIRDDAVLADLLARLKQATQ